MNQHASALCVLWTGLPIALVAAVFAAALAADSGAALAAPATRPATQPSTNPAGRDWKLVWSDEFDYEGAPDPAKWGYEEGWVRNNEAQYYTRDRRENARVEKGVLIIEGRHERFPNPHFDPAAKRGSASRQFADYTAASLTTRKQADWQYGRIEVRAKLPQGCGVWPAIWMLGSNIDKAGWPACGETDIVEFVGHTPNRIYGTAHFQKDGKPKASGHELAVDKPFDDFHTYAVEWFPDHIDWFYDDQKYHTFQVDQAVNKGENPFRKPFFLIINLALGGDWGKAIDPSIFPQKYLVKDVRVFQETGSKGVRE